MLRVFVAVTAAFLVVGGAIAAGAGSGGQNTHRVTASITYTNANIKVRACQGGFDLSSDAQVHLKSADPMVSGTIVGHLNEVANSADDAYLIAHGTFRSANGKYQGTASLTAVDRGNALNGVYVIRLANGAGVIVGNTASNQDRPAPTPSQPAGGHGELGSDRPLAPHNFAVIATSSCSGHFP